ncbi:hypothetical protein [Candidatus Bealeia paramacronuclearis]
MYQDVPKTSVSPVRKSFLDTQLGINSTVVATTERIYKKINKNWTYVEPGCQMSTQSAFWLPKWIKGTVIVDGEKQNTKIPSLLLKTEPDNLIAALEDLLDKPAKLECTIALTTAKIFCLKEILGEELFNRYAKAFYKLLNETQGWDIEQFFHELPLQFITNEQGESVPGSFTYITNIPLYPYFKPNGNGMGDNVICMSQDRYLGFGEIYKDAPKPLDVIEAEYLKLFNKTEEVERDVENHKKISEKFISDRNKFIEMRRKSQENQELHQIFNIKEVNHFIKTGEIYI